MKRIDSRWAPEPKMTFWHFLPFFSPNLRLLSGLCMATIQGIVSPRFYLPIWHSVCAQCTALHFALSTGNPLVMSHGVFPLSHSLFTPSAPFISVSHHRVTASALVHSSHGALFYILPENGLSWSVTPIMLYLCPNLWAFPCYLMNSPKWHQRSHPTRNDWLVY